MDGCSSKRKATASFSHFRGNDTLDFSLLAKNPLLDLTQKQTATDCALDDSADANLGCSLR